MKLIDVDSKATLEDFLTLKKVSFKSRPDDNEKMSYYRQFIRGFNFYKENYTHDISFFVYFYKKKLFTLKHIFLWICIIFVQMTPNVYFHNTNEHVT